jgi:hypothetical protein
MPPDSARCATGWHTPCSALHSTRGFARCRFRSQSPPPPPVEQQGAGAHHTDAPDATYEGALVGLLRPWVGLDQLWHRLPVGYLLCLSRREVGTDRAMGAADACRARAMSRGMRRSREIWSGDRMQGEDAEYAPAMDARGVAAIAMQRETVSG